ncbi:MAG TPA: outer membrane beta-barrel protein [Candidatus Binatia bacterium]
MKKALVFLFLILAMYMAPSRAVQAAEAEKPLEPGWLSLDSSVGAADRWIALNKAAVEGAIGIGISGYLDTSYTWSSRHPKDPSRISGRYFYGDQNKVDFNDFHIVFDKPEKDWGVGFHISGDFGRTGELLREATLWGKNLNKEPSAELRESYITTTIPVGEGIQFKGGLFVTPLGAEILPNPGSYNDEITRSFAFNFAIPLRHLGTLFSYPFLKTLTGSMGIITGWDNPRDNNGSPSGLFGVNFTPTDSFALASNIVVGPEQTHNTNDPRFTWSNVATIKPMDPLTLLLEYTFGFEQDASTPTGIKNAQWYAFAATGSWSWTDRLSTAVRTELFLDEGASRTQGFAATKPIFNVALGEVTLAGTYKFTKMFVGRAEFRQDWANRAVYKRGSSHANANQTTLGVQLLYQY